jgi:hypothetical protein
MVFQTLHINDHLLLRRYSPAPSAVNVCTCSISQTCPDPSWSGGQIVCKNGNNCTKGTVVWSTPGLIKSCAATETLLLSDLRCFFNQTCVDILLSMFNVDMPNRLPLPPATRAITALTRFNWSRFSPDDKVGTILNALAVDKWELQPNFIGYYSTCAPFICTYTINRKMDIVYVITTIIGLLGGLATILRLLVPVSVRFNYWIMYQCKRSRLNVDDQQIRNDQGKNERVRFICIESSIGQSIRLSNEESIQSR